MNAIPDWVKPGAAVAIIVADRNGRDKYPHTILRVRNGCAILDDGTAFDVTERRKLVRIGIWGGVEELHPAAPTNQENTTT